MTTGTGVMPCHSCSHPRDDHRGAYGLDGCNGCPCTRYEPVPLRTAEDVTDEVIAAALECAEAAYGLGNDFRIDWDRAYEMLETLYGFYVEENGSPADRKVRRLVRAERGDE